MTSVEHIDIERYHQGAFMLQQDAVAVEEPLEIKLCYADGDARVQMPISITMRTPGNDSMLALGFLYTEGIIQHANEVDENYCREAENTVNIGLKEDVKINATLLKRNFYTTSSCGVCGKESLDALNTTCRLKAPHFVTNAETILSLPDKARAHQQTFESTGGLHAATLFSTWGELISQYEDVGRHNALDKLIGSMIFAQNLAAKPAILLLSGRASFELLQKAAMAGIGLVCAVGAPSSLAVATAKKFGISLIGFLKADKFNVYHGKERIEV